MAVRVWNGDAYPRARLDRDGIGAADLDGGLIEPPRTLPRVNHHPWAIITSAAVNRQRSLAFGPFVGSALVRDFTYGVTSGSSVDLHTALRVVPTTVKDGVDEARGTAIEGRLLTFGRQTGATVLTPYDQGYQHLVSAGALQHGLGPINLPIRDARFFLLITVSTPTATTQASGLLTVWDGIPLDELADWL